MSQQWPLNNTEDVGEGHNGGKRVLIFVWELMASLCQLYKEEQIKRQKQGNAQRLDKQHKREVIEKLPAHPQEHKFNEGNKERTALVQHCKVNSRAYDRLKTRDVIGTQDRTQDKFPTPNPQLRKIHCGI